MSNLRPYQLQGKKDIFEAFKGGYKNVMFQLPTGGGKTVLFIDIIKSFLKAGKRVNLVAHREELITQAFNTAYKNGIYGGVIKGSVTPNYSLPLQISSIQTIQRRKSLPPADLVIIDESHHALDDNSYGRVLRDHYYNSYVLGVTATPYRLSGEGFTNLFDKLIKGPTFQYLVNAGYLTPLDYYAAFVPDLVGARMSAGDYRNEDAEKAMSLAPIVESYVEHCLDMCGVVFAVNISHSMKIVDEYNRNGIPAAHLSADTHPVDRARIIKDFKEGRVKVISNVGIITEGFDFPDLQFVQLARPTKSLSMFLQMVGRVTRTDYNVIKDAIDDDHRALLVSQCKKPYGLVLDNAGLYREHGMPDHDFDWERYFNGTPKKKKGEEIQEIIEYIAEDTEGRTVRTKIPKEIEGMKLVQITRTVKEKLVNLKSIKEFDRLYAIFSKNTTIKKKKWYAVYMNFKKYCDKNSILMVPEVWEYINMMLVERPDEALRKNEHVLESKINDIKAQYSYSASEMEYLISLVKKDHESKEQKIKLMRGSATFFKKEQDLYNKQNGI